MPLSSIENVAGICDYHWEIRKMDVKIAAQTGCTCWEGYERVPGTKPCASGSCRKKQGKTSQVVLLQPPSQRRAPAPSTSGQTHFPWELNFDEDLQNEMQYLMQRMIDLRSRNTPKIDLTRSGPYSRRPLDPRKMNDRYRRTEYWPDKEQPKDRATEEMKTQMNPERTTPNQMHDNSYSRDSFGLMANLKETIAHQMPNDELHVHDEDGSGPQSVISVDEPERCNCIEFENEAYKLDAPPLTKEDYLREIEILKRHNPMCSTCLHPYSTHTGELDLSCDFGHPEEIREKREYPTGKGVDPSVRGTETLTIYKSEYERQKEDKKEEDKEWKKTVPPDRLLEELRRKTENE